MDNRLPTEPNDHADPTDWIAIAAGPPDEMESSALVLEAVGIPFRSDQRAGRLLVAVGDAAAALFHLEEYRRENACWPPLPQPAPAMQPQLLPTLPVLLCLALLFAHTGSWTPENDWFTRGALDSAAVFDRGEWWRLVTALTLHADLAHLLGNCLIGGLIVHLLGGMIGFGQCWLLLIVTGALGNLVNIAVRHEAHLSVGFSTSVFAAIGVLTGLQLARSSHRSIRALLLPLGAGAGLFAFFSGEGARTDLGAHLFGFACGFGGGWLGERCGLMARLHAFAWQVCLFLLALAAPVAAWVWAWR